MAGGNFWVERKDGLTNNVVNWNKKYSNDPDKVGLKVNFSNAFNNVDCNAMLKQCQSLMPSIYQLTHFLYASCS